MPAMTSDDRKALIDKYGFVPGDLLSMAEAIIRGSEKAAGLTFTGGLPTLPTQLNQGDAAEAERIVRWKAKHGRVEIVVEYTGFTVHAFSEGPGVEEKDSLRIEDSSVAKMVDFIVRHVTQAGSTS